MVNDDFDLQSFLDRYAPEEPSKNQKVSDGAKVQIQGTRQTLKPKENAPSAWGAGLRSILDSD